ncbi:MAG: Ku protein [Solirubrobacteraceae bacterium]
MPRALWSGSLSFGLVNVPVSLMPATRNRDIRMREIDADRGEPVTVRRICTADGSQVPIEEVARGLEVDGTMVMLTDEELAAAQPRRTDTIEIESFIELSEVDSVMYDRAYWLAPSGEAQGPLRAYRLLVEAMAATGRAALGETVIHNREHPVLVRAHEERLLLSTLLFAHEIRDIEELAIPDLEPEEQALRGMIAMIEELSTDFEPARYRDRHRDRLKALIDSKLKGQPIEIVPEPPAPSPTPDLIGALEESLAQIRAKHPQKAKAGRGARKAPSAPPSRQPADKRS